MSDGSPTTPEPSYVSAPARQRRPRGDGGHRTNRVDLAAAAARVGETPAGYAARVALAVARGELHGVDVAEVREVAYALMQSRTQLGRAGGLLNQAVVVLHSTGEPPAWLAGASGRPVSVTEPHTFSSPAPAFASTTPPPALSLPRECRSPPTCSTSIRPPAAQPGPRTD